MIEEAAYNLHDQDLRAFGIGFSGAHRTGKTTLAKLMSDKNEMPFVQSSMSALANEMGIKIGLDMPFEQRREFQERALVMFEDSYRKYEGVMFFTDRTPIDLIGYVMTAWHPNYVTPELTEWAYDYTSRCIDATNRWFFNLFIVPPADIPYEDAQQKGENIDFYRESLHATMVGVSFDDKIRSTVALLERSMTDLTARANYCASLVGSTISEYRSVLGSSLTLH